MAKKNIAYRASVVENYGEGDHSGTKWIDVGVSFAHDDGKCFDIVLAKGLSVSNRLVLREPLPAKES
ncbi:hypothetical protein M2650_01845 [Luteimonas sp. SX5]|uniref:Uncharacterized protein n=1 Tax=Luteimonas galliterrae TaxID=2940486 RepID=A0ABT0MEU8_9GAMM|nr:hypothetical protein [Luteimonas galliterrae]MCL1633390.1 hypothetical protein [Luteimonas galliterrae]